MFMNLQHAEYWFRKSRLWENDQLLQDIKQYEPCAIQNTN